MNVLIAPPASGKTTYLLKQAAEFAHKGKRVWWVGLPSQRGYIYQQATQEGALLGLEFLSSQQVYYRLLAHGLCLKPLLVGTGRLALVGQALLQLRGDLPAPGEARLFARAIAEAKRYGLTYRDIKGEDEEIRRFREVFRVYEVIKEERWDYDDFRIEALAYAQGEALSLEADLIIVDGFREIGPLDLRLYQGLAKYSQVWLSLPEAPPGFEQETLSLPPDQRKSGPKARGSYQAANPVVESRWVLRALKRDLATGFKALDLAVILPQRHVRAFTALADEYGVPLMDETPKALGDTIAGRLLLNLLDLPDYPTASKLLAVPELAPLAKEVLDLGVTGLEAISIVAERLGVKEAWQKWRKLLETIEDELAWAESLLEVSLPEIREELLKDKGLDFAQFKAHALQRAKEASSLAKGASFRAWWAALLQETFLFDRPHGGVALLNEKLASGRQFKKVYIMHAVEGAYTVGEREDYFLPEEDRQDLRKVIAGFGLPKRFLGRDIALYKELLTRGHECVVTYSEADQAGPLVPERALVKNPMSLPSLPAASRLELAKDLAYQANLTALSLAPMSLQALQRYDECAFRHWAEKRLPLKEEAPWWRTLIVDLRAHRRLNDARLEVLKANYPDAALWLSEHAERLKTLSFGVSLPEDAPGPSAYVDAAGRKGNEVQFYRFVEPGRQFSQAEAGKYIDKRWNELWAAGHMLERFESRISCVHIYIWPLLAEPIAAYDGGVAYVWRRIENRQQKVAAAYQSYQQGNVNPNPGFVCRQCRVFDVCREGRR